MRPPQLSLGKLLLGWWQMYTTVPNIVIISGISLSLFFSTTYRKKQNPLRSCISPRLVTGSLRYFLGFSISFHSQRVKLLEGKLDGHRRSQLACMSILACMGHRPVAQSHQCKGCGTDCKDHMFDVRLKQACILRWPDWWRPRGRNRDLDLCSRFACHKRLLPDQRKPQTYSGHRCTLILDNTDRSACRRHFLSNSPHTKTCDSTLWCLCNACEHCTLGSNNLVISSFSR